MRKYIFYIFILTLCIALFFLTRGNRTETIVFWGFSENKEHEVNFDYDVKVMEIPVNSGQYVRKGDPLIKVERTSNPIRISELENKISLLELKRSTELQSIENEIKSLRTKQQGEISQIEGRIRTLKSEIARNQSLREIISKSTTPTDTTIKSRDVMELEELEKQKDFITIPSQLKIANLQDKLLSIQKEYDLQIKKLMEEKEFFVLQENNHLLTAPTDGIVGFINCSPGENYSSFSKLLSLYDPHPQLVKAYIPESMITSIKINDPVRVSSITNPEYIYEGRVTGFGTRIMEIPNRLSKIPELKMYGREVLISIPVDNNLLQKEKVMVELIVALPYTN